MTAAPHPSDGAEPATGTWRDAAKVEGRVGRLAVRAARPPGHAVPMGARTQPGWIDHDVSDPGVTLLEVVTFAVGVVGVAVAVIALARARRAS